MDDAWPIFVIALGFGAYVIWLVIEDVRYRIDVWRGDRLEPWQRRARMEKDEDRQMGFPINPQQ